VPQKEINDVSGWRRPVFLPIVLVGMCSVFGCNSRTREWPYTVQLGDASLKVEVAATPEQRERGLMFRDDLDENWGMLFAYDDEWTLSFWMKNTKIPLSIAFIDRGLVVRDIQDMTPMTEEMHTSKVPVMYAIEVNRGWFVRHDIAPGTVVTFSPELEKYIKQAP